MITKVTITGADDTCTPADLLNLSRKYPFVEWGILFGSSRATSRFPSLGWIDSLTHVKAVYPDEIQLSAHLCGKLVRSILLGSFRQEHQEIVDLMKPFSRIQLNTHGMAHSFFSSAFLKLVEMDKQIIFQADGNNKGLIETAEKYTLDYGVLFDKSGGRGTLPSKWPDLIQNVYCGYAGGLSPDNLEAQIERIEQKAGDTPIWIDMETHVRSLNDKLFDLAKVEKCLRIASPHILSTYEG
jgi:phosphoribosylanthranilate isomerase